MEKRLRSDNEILELRNPHSVLAALERRPQDVFEICLPPGGAGDAWQRVATRAREDGVPVNVLDGPASDQSESPFDRGAGSASARSGRGGAGEHGGPRGGRGGPQDKRRRDRRPAKRAPPDGGRHGWAMARVQPLKPRDIETVLAVGGQDHSSGGAEHGGAHGDEGGDHAAGSGHGLWLALDCVQDPHNLGAVFRSAAFFGVRGILLTRDRSAPLTAVAYDVSSGGVECVPFASPTNLDRALKTARDNGLWILGAAEEAERDVDQIPRDRSWLLVLGNEQSGLRRLTREACDDVCRLTSRGAVGSLNVSVAGAVLMSRLTATDA